MKLKIRHGFSLTEMMVSMAIFTAIIAGIYATLYVGNISWSMQDASIHVQSEVRRAMDKMSRDLRVASGVSITQDADNVNVFFSKSGSSVSYTWTTDAGGTQYQLIRTIDTVATVIAQDISVLSFTQTAADIKVNITASVQARGQTIDYTLAGNVAKR